MFSFQHHQIPCSSKQIKDGLQIFFLYLKGAQKRPVLSPSSAIVLPIRLFPSLDDDIDPARIANGHVGNK